MGIRFLRALALTALLAVAAGLPTQAIAHKGHKTSIEVVQATIEIAKNNAAAETRVANPSANPEKTPSYVSARTEQLPCNGSCNCSICDSHCHCTSVMITHDSVIERLPSKIALSSSSDPARHSEPIYNEQPPKPFA
jgi:hypothetical protein